MSQFDQIPDSYIDGIVKANQIGTPDPTKTSGVGLRELIKRLRDRVQAGGGVVTVNTFTDLTSPGDDDAIYITRDTRKEYRWDGTLASYVQLSFADLSQYVPYTGATGDVNIGSHNINANSFIKTGGTSSQFLKADGSVDSSIYLTTGDAGSTYLPLSGGTVTGPIILPNTLPTTPLQAVSKSYIDNIITGLTWKNAVHVKTTGNITLSGLQTIDGVSLGAGDRILVANQTDATQNGIYVSGTGAWARADDSNTGTEILKSTVMVEAGGAYANTQWTNTNTTVPVIGTDVINYTQISGAGTYTNGTGITLSANVFSLDKTYTDSLYAPISGGDNYIQNQDAVDQPANFWINGSGYIDSTLLIGDTNSLDTSLTVQNSNPQGQGAWIQGGTTKALSNYQTTRGGYALAINGGDVNDIAVFFKDEVDFNVPLISISSITATSFIKSGGTSNQFLKADGSVDTNTYSVATGTTNTVAKFTGANALGNSLVYDDGTGVAIGNTSPSAKLHITSPTEQLRLGNNTSYYASFTVNGFGNLTIAPTSSITHITGDITATNIRNSLTGSNANIALSSNGIIVSRNQPDAFPIFTVNNLALSSTGHLADFASMGVVKAYVSNDGSMSAPSFIKQGGTSSQFLKADGSVDGNTYLTTEVDPTVPSYAKSLTAFSVIQASTDALYLPLHGTADNSDKFNNMSSDFSTLGSTLSQFVGIDSSNTYKPYSVSQVAAALSGNWLPLYGTADAATYWGNRQANFDDIVSSPLRLVATDNGDGLVKQVDVSQVQSWLGLGANAYSSRAYLPITAGGANSLTNPLYITSNTSGIEPYHILMQAAGANPQSLEIGVNTTSGYGYLQSLQAGVSYNNTPLAIMPNGGKVLIGTTIDSGALLQVNGAITAGAGSGVTNKIGTVSLGQSGNGYPVVGANISYTTTANSYTYTNNDIAWGLDFGNGGSNYFRLRYAPSGTAGTGITFTDNLIVSPLGNAVFRGFITATGLSTFYDGTQGAVVGAYTGAGGYGAIYPYGVAPANGNYSIAFRPNDVSIQAASAINSYIGSNIILSASSTGISVTGTGSFTGAITASAFHGTADNASAISGITSDISAVIQSATIQAIVGQDVNNTLYRYNAAAVSNFLGLGSAAYTSSGAYLPLHGTADNSALWHSYSLDNSTAYTGGFDYVFARTTGTAEARLIQPAGMQSWLGLGSAAFTSSGAYLSSAGGTINRVIADATPALTLNLSVESTASYVQLWEYGGTEVAHLEIDGTFVSNSNIHASGNLEASGYVQGSQLKLSELNTAPSSSSDTGTQGEIRFTSDYIFLCTGTNTWKRAALTSF